MADIQHTDTGVRADMRAFVEDNFLYLQPELRFTDDDPLLALGIIDSLGFVELVEEIQARYGVTIEDLEITEGNFGSVAAIAAFVERKQRAS
jgi:acyl carrier protein